ncbi:biotin transporter BioY [Demequina aurantiaca]|uniref:biotin transporter BioY n=1 Tax=Demequina aurantiaca TaxID=676200 RepID=UPI0007855E05|nr:biotin transporter BioY [Demequina aurantiaca]
MSLHKYFTGTNVALIAVFAGLIAVSTAVPEITLVSGVPISLQTFATVLAAMVLGPWRGLAAVGLYIAVGLVGAPIFANGVAGFEIFARPSWGYLVGMLIATIPVGLIVRTLRRRNALNFMSLLGAGLVSLPVIYAFGVPVLSNKLGINMLTLPAGCEGVGDFASGCVTGLTVGTVPFLPGDLVKIVIAAAVAAAIHRAYPWVLGTKAKASKRIDEAPVATLTDENVEANHESATTV